MAPVGHSSAHAPHAMQSSVILYAMVTTSYQIGCSYCITIFLILQPFFENFLYIPKILS
jgi:hypothetical protein